MTIDTHATMKLTKRLRRLRHGETLRALVRETRLAAGRVHAPAVCLRGRRRAAGGVVDARRVQPVGRRSRQGSRAAAGRRYPQRAAVRIARSQGRRGLGGRTIRRRRSRSAVRAIKRELPDVLVATDVCLCEYTDHGHCGIIVDDEVANDPTVDQLVRAAMSHAVAGADIIAPSDMMDGRVGAIRQALDERGFENTSIMAYAAKYWSVFYGPFREAADSAPEVRRSAVVPDGPGQRGRGVAGGRAGHRGRRRHCHGEAGAALSGCALAREARVQATRRPRTR